MSAMTITDAEGRRLTLRRLNALEKLRLFKAAGPALSENQPWLGMAMLASSVSAIDDVPYPQPANEQQVEGMVSRLGESGLESVAAALDPDKDVETAEAVITAGNSRGTPT